MSMAIEAEHPGPCLSCHHGIRPGQLIQLNDDAEYGGRWEHVTCPPAPEVCGVCFTQVARNGACLCGVI
jgi:hypothetical protein